MPANPQDLLNGVREFGKGLAAYHAAEQDAQNDALRVLEQAARSPGDVAARVEAAAAADADLRCALPHEQGLSSGFPCDSGALPPALIAVDGSQIVPDRHEEILFGLINTGAVVLVPGSGAAPRVTAQTHLLWGDQVFGSSGRLLSEGDLALMRDSAERRALLQYALAPSSLALTDGTLELWGPKDPRDPGAFNRALGEYIDQLHEIHRRGITLAGYVDKPGADLVTRMLEIFVGHGQAAPAARANRPLRRVSDRHLFGSVLGAGCRSAVFGLVSASSSRYSGELAIFFFYLNIGDESHPLIARVEIPGWVAADPQRLSCLHGALLEQCRLLGSRPYPYVLHRAHETARISSQEQAQIKLQLLLEMRAAGLDPEALSGKSSAKAVSGRGGRH